MSHPVFHPLTLARYELRRFRGPLPSLALVFILLIPLLYGCIYLAGNWDPYGNLDRVPVAVVNEDRPISYGGERITAGQDFVDSLHRAGTFDFSDTTAREAEDGLREGRYYLVISVPPQFSADLVSGNGDHPQRAQIKLHRNDANGFVIGTITNSAQNSIARAIDETATRSYFEAVFANLSRIRAGMQDAAAGAKTLDEGLDKAHEGAGKLSDGLGRAEQGASTVASGAAQLHQGIGQAAAGAEQLDAGLGELDHGAGTLADGARRVADGTHQLATTVDPVLELAAQHLPRVQARLTRAADVAASITGTWADGSQTLEGVTADTSKALDDLVSAHPELAGDPAVQHLQQLAATAEERAASAGTDARSLADAVAAADSALHDAGDLGARAATAKAKVDQLDSGAQQVAQGAEALHRATGEAHAGATKLDEGLARLDDGSARLVTGTEQLSSGLDDLADGAAQLEEGVGRAAAGAHELATSLEEGAARLPALTTDEVADAVQVLSSPVDVSMSVDNPAHVYGRGLAPMFFSIALWVLGISAFFLVRPITGRAIVGRASDLRIALTAWLPLGGISVVAGWLMLTTSWAFLGLHPVHPWLTIALVTVVALAFSAVAHLLRTALGFVATAAMLVLLIIQLTSAGGTYPPELLPPFFAAIGHVMPMTYTIDAFRIAISGGLMAKFVRDLLLMGVLYASCLALLVLVVHAKRRFRVADLHPALG